MALIELKHVVGGYGGAPILNGVDMAIEQSDIGVIVGPNGAGKSTTLKAIFGLLKVTGGTIEFDGEDVANSLPDQLVPKGRALMSKPRLLMLDEPSAGLSPRYVIEIFETIVRVNAEGVGILMVEQNARQALAFASRGFVLAGGQNRFTGTGAELIADPDVAKSFLGG